MQSHPTMTLNEAPSKPRRSDTIAPPIPSKLDNATFNDHTQDVPANLEGEELGTALRQWLVQPKHPIRYDAAVCWTYIKTAIMAKLSAQDRGDSPSADNEAAKQQLKEAANIYYPNNQFIVPLELLNNFLHDTNGTVGTPGLALGLIRDLTVVITVWWFK